jgi:integrase
MNLCIKDVESKCGHYFLVYSSVKTDCPVTIKLPQFAVDIFHKYAKGKDPRQKLFPRLAVVNFNKKLRKIGALAGWTEETGKYRTRCGQRQEIKWANSRLYRFCDHLSSHVMRKTGITMLLMLGMPEYMVRKISGHTAYSKEFFRYVNFAQSYITEEIDKVHQKLLGLYKQ